MTCPRGCYRGVAMQKPTEQKRFVIYTRCSTDEQAQGDFTTLDAQAFHCKNMLDAFGYELADIGKKGIIADDGYSGKDLNRPGIQTILKDIQNKKSFDGVVFFRLDRLTRNPRDLYALIDLFRANDIGFVSVRENLDSSTAIGRVVIGILGLLSAFERELTGERVKASCIARVKQGRWVGGRLPYGYKLENDGAPLPNGHQKHKILVDEKVAPDLISAWELAADNKSLTEIGLELQKRGIPSATGKNWRRQTLSMIIKNPFYKGYMHYSGELHKGTHDPIVDEKLWERANMFLTGKMPGHKFIKKIRNFEYMLAGMVKCGLCGSHMVASHAGGRNNKKFFYYECSRARQKLGCAQHRLSATAFERAIINYLRQASKDQDIVTSAIGSAIVESRIKLDQLDKTTKEKETLLYALRHEAAKLLELAMNGTVSQGSTLKTKMTAIEAEITKLDDELTKLIAQKRIAEVNAHSGEFLHKNICAAMRYLDKIKPSAQKSLLRAMIKDVYIYEDKIAINMFIGEPIEDPLPALDPKTMPHNDKRPTLTRGQDGALAQIEHGSTDCHNWLPG